MVVEEVVTMEEMEALNMKLSKSHTTGIYLQ